MKRKIIPFISLVIVGMYSLLGACHEVMQLAEIEVSLDTLQRENDVSAIEREAITFILGEDKDANNPYYQQAINYYAFNPTGKTEHLVLTCRSLQEVIEYLQAHRPSNGQPWGLVNLVSHGNQWLGLSAKVTPTSKRGTVERIKSWVTGSDFQHLPPQVMDKDSEVFIHGCGLGNNLQLMKVMAKAFGGNKELPTVRASKLYEYYTSESHGNGPVASERYMAQTYSISYKMGYQPKPKAMVQLLEEAFPGAPLEWNDALTRERPRWPGDTYHFTFQVPVKWVIPYDDAASLPDVSDKKKQLAWIDSQNEITDKLKEMELPADQFNWWFRQVYVNNEDGSRSPAIWVKGYCTILSVIQALTEEGEFCDQKKPLNIAFNDRAYYTSLKGRELVQRNQTFSCELLTTNSQFLDR